MSKFRGKYSFLSNFYPIVIEYEGIKYPSAEHAYQGAKAIDLDDKLFISKAKTPGESKHLGRQLIKMRADWDEVKLFIMDDILRIKFSYPYLKQALLNTIPSFLIEGNTWHDNYWGNCDCSRCCHAKGLNNLGKILMSVRNDFLAEIIINEQNNRS